MSEEQKEGAAEPTMEEILSSIRRIISDEDQPAPEAASAPPAVKAAAAPKAAAPAPAPAEPELDPFDAAVVEPEAEAEVEAESEDVLELTQMVNEDGTVTDIDALMVEDEPEPAPEEEEKEKEEIFAAPPPRPRMENPAPAPIMDDMAANLAAAALNQLVVEMPKYIGIGQGLTLEEITRELLRPMLKQWLDAHLPGTVERLVQEEIARVSRLHS